MDTEYSGGEQQQRRQIDNDWKAKVQAHIDQEDTQIQQIEDTLTQIEADLKPIKNLYFAAIGCASAGAVWLHAHHHSSRVSSWLRQGSC